MGVDQRKHPRAPLGLLVQYRFDTFEAFMSEMAVDISLGGMFIRTDEPRELGSLVYLQFALQDGEKLIEGLGRVVRVNPKGGPGTPGMGIEFVNLDEQSHELVEQVVRGNMERGKK
jgi:uncharacterized protein (TIGR02266 family)